MKQHQRRLPVTRSLLSILHIPVCYLSCYVDREPDTLCVFGDPETFITPQITVCFRDSAFSTALSCHCCTSDDVMMIINVKPPKIQPDAQTTSAASCRCGGANSDFRCKACDTFSVCDSTLPPGELLPLSPTVAKLLINRRHNFF